MHIYGYYTHAHGIKNARQLYVQGIENGKYVWDESRRIGRLDIYVYKQWIEIVEKNSFQAFAMYLYIV